MLKPFLPAGMVALSAAPAFAQTQYEYRSSGARYLGRPAYYRDHNEQPFTQTPTYYYNSPGGYSSRAQYDGYEGRSHSYAPPAYGYTEEQNYRERRAFAENQRTYGRGDYANADPSRGFPSQAGAGWRDDYGRSCYWRNRSGDDRYPDWVQNCR